MSLDNVLSIYERKLGRKDTLGRRGLLHDKGLMVGDTVMVQRANHKFHRTPICRCGRCPPSALPTR